MFREYDYENKPVVDIVNEMIIDAINKKASDIHFDPTEDCINVRIRVDGELLEYAKVPEFVKKNLLTRIKIISGMNITETRLPQDGAIKNLTDQIDLDLRVSSLPIVDGEKIVIRILDYSMSQAGLETLGLTPSNLEKVKKLIHMPNGIILVAGATGSGKSTTVYSMLAIINTVSRNIITVEDPVEMKIQGINQVQVMSEIGLTFGTTLRSILRQDPDVIMIGEIRDDETARIAVRASITGHLVLSTIHTNNSLNTIERLLDMDVERYLLGSALTGVISQRLVKRLCPKCRTVRPATQYEKVLFKTVLKQDVDSIYTANGCSECINGYKGRIAIHEVLVINQDIRDAITNNLRKTELRHLVYDKADVKSLLEDGLQKVVEGYTSIEEILRVIDIDSDIDENDIELKNAFIGKIANTEVKLDVNTTKEENNQTTITLPQPEIELL
jgi:type IV pilus assembly protein PilB